MNIKPHYSNVYNTFFSLQYHLCQKKSISTYHKF